MLEVLETQLLQYYTVLEIMETQLLCYNTVLEILERVELFYNFERVGNSGKSWCVSSADAQDIGRTMFQTNKLST